MSIVEEYSQYKSYASEDYFSESHGRNVLNLLLIQALDENGKLEDKNINKLQDPQFIAELINSLNFRNDPISQEQFLRFLSYLYFKNKQDIYHDAMNYLLEHLTSSSLLKNFLLNKGKISQINDQQRQQQIMASEIKFVSDFSSDIKSSLQQTNSSQKINVASQNNFSRAQQVQPLQNKQQLQSNISTQDPTNYPPQAHQGYFYQAQHPQPNQQNKIVINQQRVAQDMQGSNLIDQKQEYFQKLVRDSMGVEDSISQLQQMQQKWTFLEFEFDHQIFNGNQFICSYSSKRLNIPAVYSKPKSKKKEAQHEAARIFLPYLQFYQKYQIPYFETEEQEREYLALKNNQQQEKPDYDQESENQQTFNDLKLVSNYQDDIVAVNLLVQQHEKIFANEVLKFDDSNKQDNFFTCTVTFQKGGKVLFEQKAFGTSKKFAKQAAFMKIHPQILQYYNPDVEIEQLKKIHNKPMEIQNFQLRQHLMMDKNLYQVNNDDIDY